MWFRQLSAVFHKVNWIDSTWPLTGQNVVSGMNVDRNKWLLEVCLEKIEEVPCLKRSSITNLIQLHALTVPSCNAEWCYFCSCSVHWLISQVTLSTCSSISVQAVTNCQLLYMIRLHEPRMRDMCGLRSCNNCDEASMPLAWAISGPGSHWHMMIYVFTGVEAWSWWTPLRPKTLQCYQYWCWYLWHAIRHPYGCTMHATPVLMFGKDRSYNRYANSHAGAVYCACNG